MPATGRKLFTDLIMFDSPDLSKSRQSHHAHFTDVDTEALKSITDQPASMRDLDTSPGLSVSRVDEFDSDVLPLTPSMSKSLPKWLIVQCSKNVSMTRIASLGDLLGNDHL